MVETELVVKIASGGAAQTVRDVVKVQEALAQLGRNAKDTAALAKALGKAFDLDPSEVEELADALGKAKTEAGGLAGGLKQTAQSGGILQGVFQGIGQQLTQIGFQAITSSLQALTNELKATISGFIEFEAAIKQAGVVSGSFGTPEFEALGKEVERLGIVTSKTPQEIAATAVALSRAGFKAEETAAALEGIARASEASGEGLEVVGDIVAKTTRAFGLAAEDSLFLSNALVATANNTNTTVSGLGESFNYVAATAAAANQPVDDMLVLIGLLGDAGIQGSSAGTGLAAALDRLKIASAGGETEFSNLVRGSARASEAFNVIGAEVRNADGSMKSMLEILPVVQQNLSTLGQADKDVLMKALFGVEGGRAFQTLLNATPERVAQVSEEIKVLAQEGEGAAIRAGEQMLSGLSGAIDLIGGSVATFGNQFAGSLAPALEGIVRFATEVINALIEVEGLFDPLSDSAERFNLVLTQNPALVEEVASTLAGLIEEGVKQFALLIDAITAFTAEEENIQAMADALDDTVTIITTLGRGARFVVALTESLIKLKTITEELPIVGKAAQQGMDMVNPFKSVELLRGGVAALGQAWEAVNNIVDNTKEFLAAIINRFDVLANNPVVKALVAQLVQAETAVGGLGSSLSGSLTAGVEAVGEAGQNAAKGIAETNAALAESTTETAEAVTATEEATSALDGLATANRNALDDITTDTDNAKAALLENGGTQAEIAALEKKALEDRIAQNKTYLQQLKDAQASGGLSEEEALQVADTIRQVEGKLASDRVSLAQTVANAQRDAAKAQQEAVEAAAKVQADALKETRDEAKRLAEVAFGDAQKEEGVIFSEAQAAAAEAFQTAQQADQEAFNKAQQTDQEAFNDQQQSKAKAFQSTQQADQESFADSQAAAAKAFQKGQQAEAENFQKAQQASAQEFQKQLDAERDQGGREFNVLTSEVERRVQLEQAASDQQRRELEEQFKLEDEQLKKRRDIEAEVLRERGSVLADRQEETQLGPLEQARADFEQQLQDKAEGFQALQQEAAAAFQAEQDAKAEAFAAQQEEADRAFKAEQDAAAEAFAAEQKEADKAFQAEQDAAAKAFQEAQQTAARAFSDEQKALDRAFQAEQQNAERAFKDEQRQLDKANAEAIARILEAAKPRGIDGARRDGGPVLAGGTYLVGEDGPELVTPRRGGYVYTAQQTAALIAGLPTMRGVSVPALGGTARLEGLMGDLLQEVRKGRQVRPQSTYNLTTAAPVQDAMALQLAEIRALMDRRGL